MMNATTTYIGSYRIERTLGEGTFGVVYQAYEPFLDRQVAVKTLHTDLSTNPKIEQQFMVEARTIARLRHPNIVTVYEFRTVPADSRTITYLAMEYLSGQTLKERMQAGRLSTEQAVDIIDQLAQGLDYAHAHHIVHRDLKPANILFTDQNQPVIVDFGLAQLVAIGRTDSMADADASTMSGTPAYMAPEQFLGEPTGPYTDQYALATIAYELLSGKRPYDDASSSAYLVNRVQAAPMPITVHLPNISTNAELALQRALAKDPKDRYGRVSDFARELGDALLPDRQHQRSIIVSDPLQAARLQAAQQTISGFLWGMAAVTLTVMLFSVAIFLRGSAAGSNTLFVWDGIFVRTRLASGQRMVTGLWPGSVAERAGVKVGDLIDDDLLTDHQDLKGNYTVNGVQRSVLPTSWEPHLGDVIARAVIRDGQPVQITYVIERSSYPIFLLIIFVIPAILALVAAAWLMRRWGPEPGLQIFFPLLLGAAFLFLTQALARMLDYMDTVAAHIVLPSLLIFILLFPEPLRILEKRRYLIWLLYIPLIVPLIEFFTGQGIPPNSEIELQLFGYIGYALAIIVAVVWKWGLRDLKRYHSLAVMLIGFLFVSATVIPSSVINAFDLPTTQHLFGSDTYQRITALWIVSIGSALAVLLTWLGYHRLQKQIGPSFVTHTGEDTSGQILKR